MSRKLWLILLIMGISFSVAFSKTDNDLKAQFESAIKVLEGQLSPMAKAKVGGDLRWKIGNVGVMNVDPDTTVVMPSANVVPMRQMMKEQMGKIGIKMKVPSEETRARVLRMLGSNHIKEMEEINKQPAFLWYQNDRMYLTGLLVLRTSKEIARKLEIKSLQDFGVLVNRVALHGDEFTVLIPIDKFAQVLEMNFIKKFKPDRTYVQNLNMSIPEIGADAVWNRTVSPADGSGVIVGVIDDGIALNHPDFQIAANNTRVKFLWDQTVTGIPPSGYAYGNECTKTQIDAGSCTETAELTVGHGTHTIGIAAGNGSASSGVYTGVAPGSDIVYVKISGITSDIVTNAGTSRIWDAIKYIITKADIIGKPVSISLSYGYQGGPHDGFADTDWLIDKDLSFNTEGISIAAAVGDDGQNNLHSDSLVCPAGAQFYEMTNVNGLGYPWCTIDSANRFIAPARIYEFYYPADKNIDAGTAGYDNYWGWGKLRVNSAYLDLLPSFAGIQNAAAAGPTQINLNWDPAIVDECPTGASYDIFRIQGACPFTPASANRKCWLSMFLEKSCFP